VSGFIQRIRASMSRALQLAAASLLIHSCVPRPVLSRMPSGEEVLEFELPARARCKESRVRIELRPGQDHSMERRCSDTASEMPRDWETALQRQGFTVSYERPVVRMTCVGALFDMQLRLHDVMGTIELKSVGCGRDRVASLRFWRLAQ
jgi:hypothetical protein